MKRKVSQAKSWKRKGMTNTEKPSMGNIDLRGEGNEKDTVLYVTSKRSWW